MSLENMVKECALHIGYKEGSTTPYGRWYDQITKQKGFASAPWCDMFLSYCASQVGELGAVGLFAYTPNHVEWFKTRREWHDGITGIKRGDIVFFNWDGGEVDHVGIVTQVSMATVHTIEGNTGDSVATRIREQNVIAGYGRPNYGARGSTPPTRPEPSPGVPLPKPALSVDGDLGTLSCKALQRVLNYRDGSGLAVDGELGPLTRKALQRALNRGKL